VSAGSARPGRKVLLVAHPRRQQAQEVARAVVERLYAAGIQVVVQRNEATAVNLAHQAGVTLVDDDRDAAAGCELVCVLGGDGTILRGAEVSRGTGAPLLGVNLGHVGFLAEAEREDIDETVEHIVARTYAVEERMTLEVSAHVDGDPVYTSWALNEVTVEKANRERMLEVVAEIDGRPLTTWGCDGVVVATPTGSTAYAFSAGGPVVWPSVEAILVVPISAHALFARPLVAAPSSTVAIELPSDSGGAIAFCDGRRTIDLRTRDRLEITRGCAPIRLVRLSGSAFTDRLVGKFHLPVRGWRGPADEDGPTAD
jgi:NAD+ kinase